MLFKMATAAYVNQRHNDEECISKKNGHPMSELDCGSMVVTICQVGKFRLSCI